MLKQTIVDLKKQKHLLLSLPLVAVPFLGGYGLKTYHAQHSQPAIGALFQASAINGLAKSRNLSAPNGEGIDNALTPQQQLQQLHSVSISVSQQFPEPGEGIPHMEGLQKLLESQEGHCGHFVYLFARQLQELGYPYTIYGITSNTSWSHALIEVTVEDEPFLFDPSNGIYYPHSLTDLIGNPDLTKQMVGIVSENYKPYALPAFFGDINRYYAFQNTNSYEHNVIGDATLVSASPAAKDKGPEKAIDDATATYYVSADQQPASIEIDLAQKEQIYRVSAAWLSVEDYATDITLQSVVDGKTTTVLDAKNQTPGGSITNIMLKKPVEAEKLIFTFSNYQGNNKLSLRDLKAFRY
ncbi:MAG: discoidin domain-containing protein [Cyanobacteria bacterium J06598_3]